MLGDNRYLQDRKAEEEFDLYVLRLKEDVKRGIEYFQGLEEMNKSSGIRKYSVVEFLG